MSECCSNMFVTLKINDTKPMINFASSFFDGNSEREGGREAKGKRIIRHQAFNFRH